MKSADGKPKSGWSVADESRTSRTKCVGVLGGVSLRFLFLGCLAVGLSVSDCFAGLRILLSNDDGFEAANLRALYLRLKEAGHDVLISAPVHNQSGRGGAVDALKPIQALKKASRHGTIPNGAPGVGCEEDNADIYYVNGTPVMALLYGLQIVGVERWGGVPDLVISGPNEGNNLGAVVVVSGTANNAFMALSFGVPAIAVSWDAGSKSFLELKEGDRPYEVADLVVRLVGELSEKRAQGASLLPKNLGLNVNIPKFKKGMGAELRFELTRLGGQALPTVSMFAKLSASRFAVANGVKSDLPGISVITQSHPETDVLPIPIDSEPDSESMASRRGVITVSPIRMAPEGTPADERFVENRLGDLFAPE